MTVSHGQGDTAVPALTRRGFLTAGSAALLLAGSGAATAADAHSRTVWIYDPTLGAAADTDENLFATAISVAKEKQTAWRELRALDRFDAAAGVTSWSDLLIIRGQLELSGMRLVESVARGPGFHWVMRQRSQLRGIR